MLLPYAWAFLAFALAMFLLWDKYKKRFVPKNERILFEDALKHLYDCEYNSVDCTPSSVGGHLSVSKKRALEIIAGLEKLKLITSGAGKLHLTDEGRSYALRVVRIHRLWEQYLADTAGITEAAWHSLAEEKEHQITAEEADMLAAKLGNPLKDPHGDPIPTSSGKMPERKGIPLSALEEGDFAVVLHIEDEPEEMYAQIRALVIYPGVQLQMLQKSADKITLAIEGGTCMLPPELVQAITVSVIREKEKIKRPYRNLSSIKEGDSAEVAGISKALHGQPRRRLLDLGIVPGTKVKAVISSIGGDPTAYEVRGALIALRKNQSDYIYIKDQKESG